MTFHKSNLGSFGDRLPCDMQGYVRTTAAEIFAAQDKYDTAGKNLTEEEAEEMAETAKAAVLEAEAALEEWHN